MNSDFIDLNVWTLMNLPLIRPVDLHTFWGSGDLQLVRDRFLLLSACRSPGTSAPPHGCGFVERLQVAYELREAAGKQKEDLKHSRDRIEYFFKMRLAHRSNHEKFDARRASRTLFPEFPPSHGRNVSEFVDEDGFFDTVDRESDLEAAAALELKVRDSPPATPERRSLAQSDSGVPDNTKETPRRGMMGWLTKGLSDSNFYRNNQSDQAGKADHGHDSDDEARASGQMSGRPKLEQTFSESGYLRTEEDPELQSLNFDEDLQYVPAVFEVEDSRKEGRRRALFAFKVPNNAEGACVLRSYSEFG